MNVTIGMIKTTGINTVGRRILNIAFLLIPRV